MKGFVIVTNSSSYKTKIDSELNEQTRTQMQKDTLLEL